MFRRFAAAVSVVALSSATGCATNLPNVRSPDAGQGLRYEAAVSSDASTLVVEASVPPGMTPYFGMATGAVPFVSELHVKTNRGWSPVSPTDTFFFIPDCVDNGCSLRYRFALREAARTLRDVDRAMMLAPDLVEAPPSTWLLRPIGSASGSYRLHVVTSGGVRFASGLFPAKDAELPHTYEGDLATLKLAPYTVFGRFDVERVQDEARHVSMQVVVPRRMEERKDDLRDWVERSARVLADYYRTFPVPHVLVVVAPTNGGRVSRGRTLGNGGASTIVWVGADVSTEKLKQDWVLPHELVHTSLPSVEEKHRWFEEGVATYVEGLARASAGEMPEETFWHALLEGLPKGLPHGGDRGLDHTPTWGRRYWGGALFCFLADMEIRRRTEGRASLADALRGIAERGGNVSVAWSLQRTLATGDAAVGASVLRSLHERMGDRPMPVDLTALWERLGVSVEEGRVVLDDEAPASALRRSMTAVPSRRANEP